MGSEVEAMHRSRSTQSFVTSGEPLWLITLVFMIEHLSNRPWLTAVAWTLSIAIIRLRRLRARRERPANDETGR
jgi:hypothetical protein